MLEKFIMIDELAEILCGREGTPLGGCEKTEISLILRVCIGV